MKSNRTLLFLLGLLAAQTVCAATITVTSDDDSGAGTLRDAVTSATDGDTINFSVSGIILLTSGELLVTNSLTILGPGAANLAVNGNAADRVFHISSNTVVSISGLTITNGGDTGFFPGGGSGIYNDHAALTVSNCTLSGNSAGTFGGGIYNGGQGDESANLQLVNSTLRDNSAQHGGGIYNDHAMLIVSNCSLNGNSAFLGGGIVNDSYGSGGASLIVVNSTLNDNTGGGIYNSGLFGGSASLRIINSTLKGNNGGGIFNDGQSGSASVQIINSTLSSNSAGFGGGAILNDGFSGSANLEIVNSTLSGNSADSGGAIFNASGSITINTSTLSGNSAGNGGGFYNDGGTLIVESSTLSGNSGQVTAGAIANIYGIATVSHSTISSGSAELGGGIWTTGDLDGTPFTIRNSTISGNSGVDGGGIYWFGGKLIVENSTISSNSASDSIGAGGISDGGSGTLFTLNNSIVAVNTGPGAPDISGSFTGSFNFIGGDPLLGPLQDNGGPTFTHALLPGSPAIDQGKNFSASATDQRGVGFARTFDDLSVPNATGGDGTDIGAFEVQQPFGPQDTDSDGVADEVDQCSDTPPGAIVNSTGCSIAQLVPCDGPRSGGTWKNHGQYVRSVMRAATDFLKAGLITRRQWAQIVTRAAHSKCGWNRRWDHDWNRDWHRNWDCGRDADWGRNRDWGRD